MGRSATGKAPWRFTEIHDVSVPLTPGMPTWPGDPPFRVDPVFRITRGDEIDLSRLQMGTHTGTHVDAPRHVFSAGPPVDRLPLSTLCGPAWVLDVGTCGPIGSADLRDAWETAERRCLFPKHAPVRKDAARRILLKTPGSARWAALRSGESVDRTTFFEHGFSGLTREAADLAVARGVRLIGIDGPSIDGPGDDLPAHRTLLDRGIAVVECLDLSRITPGVWFLCCLPLPVKDTDGAPARAILARP